MFGCTGIIALIAVLPHPFHVSVAEAQWNDSLDRLQVALRLNPRDLEFCLGQVNDQKVVLDGMSEPEARRLIEPYLRNRVFLSHSPTSLMEAVSKKDRDTPESARDRWERFHWIGWEQDVRYTWIYFELSRPKDKSEKLWLHNHVMFEADATQINTLQLMRTKPPVAIRTTEEEPAKEIPLIASRGEQSEEPMDRGNETKPKEDEERSER